ncbi:TIR domain-containing protein [Nannocystis pusilla]|uniref:Toll/interleukin-1 receptor domain-containing protein n=1 Tax=Nannocystis pusilla TaxID=889268 RepID=A0ABS7TN11_9BACT|nr:TIR domain-containing protein [Nannocystis pusilla]MBZ5709614.1 toll/interleukin-1 receptor domain-containing protein [Nannocystis pusilla]
MIGADAMGDRPKIFICYASSDREWRDALRLHLKQYERFVDVFVDVDIPAGGDWNASIVEGLRTCEGGAFLVSHHLFTRTFVTGIEIPALLERWAAEQVDLRVIRVSACKPEEHVFKVGARTLTLGSIQDQLHGPDLDIYRSKTLDMLNPGVQKEVLENLAFDLAACAVERERMRALKHLRMDQVLRAWRAAVPEGRPEPTWPAPNDIQAAVRAALRDMRDMRGGRKLERMAAFGQAEPLEGGSSSRGASAKLTARPDVRILIRRRPDAPGADWQVDTYGPANRPPSRVVPDMRLDTVLLDLGPVIAGLPAHEAHIEIVAPVFEREFPADLWHLREGEGELAELIPAGQRARLTLRSLERIEYPSMREALERRSTAGADATSGYGPGGVSCRHAKVRIQAASRSIVLHGHAQCAVFDHVPPDRGARVAVLRAAYNNGVGTLLWSRRPEHGNALAALAEPHSPADLPVVVLKARTEANPLANEITLVVDHPGAELPLLEPPSETS